MPRAKTLSEDRSYYALRWEDRPDPQAEEGVAYRLHIKVPLIGGDVHAYTAPVSSLRELGDTILEMRAVPNKRQVATPWWPSVQRRERPDAPWVTMTAYEWETAYQELTGV
ncbi:hypothetical protein SEA_SETTECANDELA_185 [Mycobacterium phage Settecandela]|nr:hypothetical protein SEA_SETTECANDELA_185 [Mycobacterium phage Settecandela]